MENLDKDFKKLAKKTKNRKRLISAGLSVVVTVAVLSGAVFARNIYVKQALAKAAEQSNIVAETQNPNMITSLTGQTQGLLGGSFEKSLTKNVDGYAVAAGIQTVNYGQNFGQNMIDYGNDSTWMLAAMNGTAPNTSFSNGQKVPSFYTPGAYVPTDNGMPPKELNTLSKLPDYLAEVAISFDKPYTYAQIEKMIPENLLTNWCWLSINNKKVNMATTNLYIGLSTNVDSYSTAMYDANGKAISNNARRNLESLSIAGTYGLDDTLYNDFVAAIKQANTISELKGLGTNSNSNLDGTSVTYYPYQDALKSVKAHPTLDTAKFSGVILTGRTENFAQLEGKSWIYASSVGATTPVLPYLSPVK